MYYEVSIIPALAGFGEWHCQPINGEGWAGADDLIAEIEGNVGAVYDLSGDAALPAGMEDIRGRIHNEPDRVFGFVEGDGSINYFGIVELN